MPLEGFAAAGERREEVGLLDYALCDLSLRLLRVLDDEEAHGDGGGEQQAIHHEVGAADHTAKVLACIGSRHECVSLVPIASDLRLQALAGEVGKGIEVR